MNKPTGITQRLILLANIGTIIEWAEFSFYAYIAVTISRLFFPEYDQRVALLLTFAIFALGYLTRPFGAIVFGYIGDHYGRKVALRLSIFLMGISTFCIGLLPSYQAIGFAAPILLLMCRAFQGLAVSGEFNGAAIYLIEQSEDQPCLAGSWTAWAAGVGVVIGSACALLVSLPHMPSWLWRLPFLMGAVACWYAYILRNKLSESPKFILAKQQRRLEKVPLLSILNNHRASFIKAFIVSSAIGVFFYIASIYYGASLQQHTNLPAYQIKALITFGELFFILLCPFMARIADKYGDKRLLTLGLLSSVVTVPLMYALITPNPSFWVLLLAQCAYGFSDALMSAPLFKYLNDLFPVENRYTGVSFAWSLSMAIFGGTAPMVAEYLQGFMHLGIAPAVYLVAFAVIAIVVVAGDRSTQPIVTH